MFVSIVEINRSKKFKIITNKCNIVLKLLKRLFQTYKIKSIAIFRL